MTCHQPSERSVFARSTNSREPHTPKWHRIYQPSIIAFAPSKGMKPGCQHPTKHHTYISRLVSVRFDFPNTVQDHAGGRHRDNSPERKHGVHRPQRRAGFRSNAPPAPATSLVVICRCTLRFGGHSASPSALRIRHVSEVSVAEQHNKYQQEVKEREEAEGEGAEDHKKAVQGWRNSESAQHRLRIANL